MISAALNALAGLVLAVNGQFYDGHGQTVEYLNVTGSDITVTDVRVVDSPAGVNAVSVSGNRNTLRNIVVERAGATGVYFVSGTGHVLEDSVIRDPKRRVGRDSWGIYSAATGSVTVRRTTVHGSGFSNFAPGGSVLLEDNEFVVPAGYRTDCNGGPEPGGACQCAEFGVGLKSGNAVIRGNRISGYRKADPVCGGSGTPGAGIAVAACAPTQTCPTRNVQITGNTITDSHDGVYVSPRSSDVLIQANRICNSDYAISDGFGAPSSILDNQFQQNEVDLNVYGSHSGPVSGNGFASEACSGDFVVASSAPPAPTTVAPPAPAPAPAPAPVTAPAPAPSASPPPPSTSVETPTTTPTASAERRGRRQHDDRSRWRWRSLRSR